MTEPQPERPGKHAAPDDDPNSDPAPTAGEGGEHAESGGTRQPGADPEDEEEIEEERERRLDPDNRPDNVEVDNTQRDFDVEKGMFEDSEGYEEADKKYPPLGGQGA